uniref:Molybdopterin molybdenumtransferase n=1 Tax=Candidatus Kentrum eta TaxID=2126337 RepID=A0A450VFB4_9GAMM|nr:MAG: molybdopterin molybdotransferase [Candidatus Kentron sp. H]VFK03486.1 MAG: molybdopterin molybdotransferase [Candidatus Kentron sp. H]VFK05783.1 MAG: molybdopterin molybdotransferase [Candidatus Kentron sp. H]
MMSVDEARAFLLERTQPITETERIDTIQGLGRVLAQDILSPIDVPGCDNSAMDGYAVRSKDIVIEVETRLTIHRRIAAGESAGESPLQSGQAARILTGAPIPSGADSVVIQEHCRLEGASVCIRGPISRGMNIRPQGNDIRAGAVVLPARTRLTPQALGLAAAMGLSSLPVFRRLRVAILSSGNELVQPGTPLQAGQCYDANRHTLFGLLANLGCEILDLGTIPDDLAATGTALREAARQADVVITSGGVSVGDEDYIKRAVENVGNLDLWRIAVKPGKPLAHGRIFDADFIGLPGNPVSVLITFCLFVRPMLIRRQGAVPSFPPPRSVSAGFIWARPGNRREYARARLVPEGDPGSPKAVLFERQGSDVLSSVVWADGLVEIPPNTVIALGDKVPYLSFAELLG